MNAAKRLAEYYDDDPTRWTQGDYHDGKGGRCLSGAITHVARGNEAGALFRRVRQLIPNDEPITRWNDDPKRTFEDIKALVEKVAA